MTTETWIELFGGIAIVTALVNKQVRRKGQRPERTRLTSGPVLHEERVIAKWTLPGGAWSWRISRAMKVQIRSGSVAVVLGNRFLPALLGTDQYFSAADITMTLTDRPSVGYPRRTWVVLTPTQPHLRQVAVSTRQDPHGLVAALAAQGVRELPA